ncbi:MAG TPA: M20/M25/M40 family metallo-hydrolase [Chloroflexaceae bacterium]|nr:M20/M25/M40 family metallo-hydrolase [Chloroflexaceae bacterium]
MRLQSATVVELLQELIRIPSPNPPGDCAAIAAFCEAALREAGLEARRLAPDGRAWSVVASVGGGPGPTLMYHAHIDTVPLGQSARWRHDPFAGELADGRVYGLGSVDDKAPMAAMLKVAADLAARRGELRGRLVVVCAADEEVGGTLGTRWLAEAGHLPACDFVVVGEQTANRVAVANKGVLRATFRVGGRTAHATTPANGRNAINGMARLILDLERYQREVLDARPHPLLGAPSINVGVIEGGVSANVVADACLIRVDRRMVPGEAPEAVMAELEAVAAAAQARDPERRYSVGDYLVSPWFATAADDSFTGQLLAISSAVTGAPPEPVGYLPGSDAKHLTAVARGGMVIFGPGTYEVAHAPDEYADVAELEATYSILRRFAEQILLM